VPLDWRLWNATAEPVNHKYLTKNNLQIYLFKFKFKHRPISLAHFNKLLLAKNVWEEFRIGSVSHAGCRREANEDALLLDAKQGLYAVADGLGGLPEGATASQLAIDTVSAVAHRRGHRQVALSTLLREAHAEVERVGWTRHPGQGFGTTLTLAQLDRQGYRLVHVGDSMAWLWRDQHWHVLTPEHTMATRLKAEAAAVGQTLSYIPEVHYHTLTQCLGQPDLLEVAEAADAWQPGDGLLLASDGLSRCLQPREIAARLTAQPDPQIAVNDLLDICLSRGAPDNVSIIWLKPGI